MEKEFISGFGGARFMTRFYEPIVSLAVKKKWKQLAAEVSKLSKEGATVVDLGCGPGTVVRFLREIRPDVRIVGTDIDPDMIAIATRKAQGMNIAFKEASIDALPFDDHSVDTAVSSFMFHHLTDDLKKKAFQEVRRILKPSGAFLLFDFSVPTPKARWWNSVIWWHYLEPPAGPQMKGQLLELGKKAGGTVETLWTAAGCVALHVFRFP